MGGASAATLDLDRYLRQESFTDIKISPGGEYIAATVPLEAGTALAIYRIADMKMVGSFRPPRNDHAHTFDWVSNERLLVGMAQKFGCWSGRRRLANCSASMPMARAASCWWVTGLPTRAWVPTSRSSRRAWWPRTQ